MPLVPFHHLFSQVVPTHCEKNNNDLVKMSALLDLRHPEVAVRPDCMSCERNGLESNVTFDLTKLLAQGQGHFLW